MPMSKQEAFDKVLAHLRQQGRRSTRPSGACVYRGACNSMCAIGALIPDGLYHPRMESMGAVRLLDQFPELHTVMAPGDAQFYAEMQSFMHDCITSPQDFQRDLELGAATVATNWNLEYASPQRGTV